MLDDSKFVGELEIDAYTGLMKDFDQALAYAGMIRQILSLEYFTMQKWREHSVATIHRRLKVDIRKAKEACCFD